LDAIEQQSKWMEASGIGRLLREAEEARRANARMYDSLLDSVTQANGALADIHGLHTPPYSELLRQVAGLDLSSALREQLTSASESVRDILGREIGPMLRAQDAFTSAGALSANSSAAQAIGESMGSMSSQISAAAGRQASEAFLAAAIGPFEDIQRRLSAEWFGFSSQLKDHAADLRRFLEGLRLPTHEELEEGHRQQVVDAIALADAGWPVPLAFAPVQVNEAAAIGRKQGLKALDEQMVACYTYENATEFESLATTLRLRFTAKSRRKWYPMLRECLQSYDARCYRAAALLVVPLLERVVADIVGLDNLGRRPTMKARTWKDKVPAPNDFFTDTLWHSVAHFLSRMWEDAPFKGPRPDRPNRHRWVHGRDPNFGSQADALRLLLALDLACFVATGLRARRRSRRRRGGPPQP
jgi:hypothetical protein